MTAKWDPSHFARLEGPEQFAATGQMRSQWSWKPFWVVTSLEGMKNLDFHQYNPSRKERPQTIALPTWGITAVQKSSALNIQLEQLIFLLKKKER